MEENRNEELHGLKGEAVRDLHKIMLEAMRSREGEILKFLGFVLSALAAFFALGLFKTEQTAIPPRLLLPISSVIAIVILGFGAWYALALSYNYRYLMIVCYWLQMRLGLLRYQPDWEPKFKRPPCTDPTYKKLDYRLFGFAPEIFRTQVLLFISLMFLVATVSFVLSLLFFREEQCDLLSLIFGVLPLPVAFGFFLLLCYLGFSFYPTKYKERIKEAKRKYQSAPEGTSEAK